MNLRYLAWAPVAASILAFGAPAASQASTSSDPVAALIESSRKAVGAQALSNIKVLQLDANATAGGLAGTTTSFSEIGGPRFAETFSNPPLAGGDGFDGTVVWNSDASGLVWVDGGENGRSSEISQAYLNTYALWSPNRGGAKVTWGGTQTEKGRTYDLLAVQPRGVAAPMMLWFDRASHLPVKAAMKLGPISATTTMSDYQRYSGLMVPRTIHSEQSDGNSSDWHVTRVVANPPGGAGHLGKPTTAPNDYSIKNGAASTTVPMELVDNHVYLNVMLNGKGPYVFIFDSGGLNLIDPAVAAAIGTDAAGNLQGNGVGSTTESIAFAKVDSLQFGDATLKDQVFAVVPTRAGFGVSAGKAVDGLIGFEVLSRFVTTFDYANDRVVFTMPSSAQPIAGGTTLPFVLADRTPQFACGIDGIAGQCSLDTGARDSITLMSPFVAAHPQVVPSKPTAVGVNGFGLGGPAMGHLGRLTSFAIGNLTIPNLIADFSTQEAGAMANPFQAANVGGGVWKRFALTLDYPKTTMTLVPNGDYAANDTYERSGLFLVNKHGAYVVIDSRPGTPAAQAGVAKGDTIFAIDGTPASKLTLQAVRELFRGAPGTTLHLEIVGKDGTHRPATLVLADYV